MEAEVVNQGTVVGNQGTVVVDQGSEMLEPISLNLLIRLLTRELGVERGDGDGEGLYWAQGPPYVHNELLLVIELAEQ